MKQVCFIIFGLISISSCSFLRDLSVTSITALDKSCVTTIGDITVTVNDNLASGDAIAFTLKSQATGAADTNNYSYSGTATAAGTTLKCTTTTTGKTALDGTYKLDSPKYTATGGTATDISATPTLTYATAVTISTSQTASQEVDASSDDKKTFTVNFDPAFSTVPKIYPNTSATTAITCTASTDKKSLTCTPTTSNMDDGESYKVAYQQVCDGDKAETGVTVKFSSGSSSSSSFAKFSFFLLGLLLL